MMIVDRGTPSERVVARGAPVRVSMRGFLKSWLKHRGGVHLHLSIECYADGRIDAKPVFSGRNHDWPAP